MKISVQIAVTLIVLYAALCAGFYFLQDRFLYRPGPEVSRPGIESFRFSSDGAVLKVWVLHPGTQRALIYFGGYADDVSEKLPLFSDTFPGATVYLVNYRSFGGSTGRPSEAALIGDAQAIYDWAAPRHERIIVMGRSLGTGVATALAASRPVERLILVTPYDSMSNVVADDTPWIPVHWLIKDHYNSAARMATVHAPVLVLVAENDHTIARARSDALINAIPPALRHTVMIRGATHDDLPLFLEYLKGHENLAIAD
jgi:pimeloyl-ACP methyl ester carboxylesterase